VRKGDVLFRIESSEAEAKLLAARAALAQAEATLAKLETGPRSEEIRAAEAAAASAKAQYDQALAGARSQEIDAARAKSDAARAALANATSEYQRQKGLYESNVAAFAAMDQAKNAMDMAKSTLESSEKELDLLVKGTRDEQIAMAKAVFEGAVAQADELKNGTRKEDIEAARGARDQAAAQVQAAEVTLSEMTITSPSDGIVETLDLRPGDIVSAGPAARILDPEDLDLSVYVSAALLGHLTVGQKISFTTDSHGNETFEGTITFISSSGEFTPRNLQTEEDRVQQVFEVKVHTTSAGGKLRAGMSGTVSLPRA
jgi:multidrug resistance efflux pump